MTTKTISQLPVAPIKPDTSLFEVEIQGVSRRLTLSELRDAVLGGYIAFGIDPKVKEDIEKALEQIAEIQEAVGSAVSAFDSAKQAEEIRKLTVVARGVAEQASMTATTAKQQASEAATAADANAKAAGVSATSASGFATTASGAATVATQKADDAGESASIASASATTATTKAGEASVKAGEAASSASDALGYRNDASSYSEVAATHAGDASVSASAAATDAQTASTKADAAGVSATAAQQSKVAAETAAGNAKSDATASQQSAATASDKAAAATSAAGLSAGYRDQAEAFASTADQRAAAASASAASASSSAELAVSVSGRTTSFLNGNPAFSDWPDSRFSEPSGWGLAASNSPDAQVRRVPGVIGRWGMETYYPGGSGNLFHAVSGLDFGDIGGGVDPGMMVNAGWFVVEADVTLLEGTLTGAGCYVGAYKANGANVATRAWHFVDQPDATDTAPGAGTEGKRYRFAFITEMSDPEIASLRFHPMTAWTGFAYPAPAKRMRWNLAGVRQATSEEIANNKARTVVIPSVSARVKTTEDAIADFPNKYAGAQRVSTIEAQLANTADSGLRTGMAARIEDRATAIADAKAGAVAQSLESVRASLDGRVGKVEVETGAIAGIDQRTSVYWKVIGTTPDGQAMISLSKTDGSAPLFYVGANMLIRGDLIVDGAITLRALNRATMTATTQASRTGGFQAPFGPNVAPVEGVTADMPIGDSGSLYFTVNASQVGSTNSAVTAAYPSVQLLDTDNNVLGDYKIPYADSRIGGLSNYVVRALNLWGARVIRWRIVNRGADGAATNMNNPAVSLYWTAL